MADDQLEMTTKARVAVFEILYPLLTQAHDDIKQLTSKKQDGVLNKTSIAMLNRLLEHSKELLIDEPSHQFLDLLVDELLPQNADALLIIGRYVSAMQAFRERYRKSVGFDEYRWIAM